MNTKRRIYLEDRGYQITCLPVDGSGIVAPDDVRKAITGETILILDVFLRIVENLRKQNKG